MKAGSLNWNETSGEGHANLSKEFQDHADRVTKLDALRDWIYELTEQYNALLDSSEVIFKAKKP